MLQKQNYYEGMSMLKGMSINRVAYAELASAAFEFVSSITPSTT